MTKIAKVGLTVFLTAVYISVGIFLFWVLEEAQNAHTGATAEDITNFCRYCPETTQSAETLSPRYIYLDDMAPATSKAASKAGKWPMERHCYTVQPGDCKHDSALCRVPVGGAICYDYNPDPCSHDRDLCPPGRR